MAKNKDAERSVVSDLINFRGMIYGPQDKSGVMLLFGKVADDLNMYVEEVRTESPDAIVRRFTRKGWERLRVDFAYRSGQVQRRAQNVDRCDMIVCWEHDWTDSPVEVVELRERIREMENWPIHRPDEPTDGGEVEELEDWFARHAVSERTQDLFQALADHVNSISEECFYRVGRNMISFYSPQRAFVQVHPYENMLRLVMFSGGKSLGDAQPLERRGPGSKWSVLTVADQDELLEAFPWVEEAHRRITGGEEEEKSERPSWRTAAPEEEETEEVEA